MTEVVTGEWTAAWVLPDGADSDTVAHLMMEAVKEEGFLFMGGGGIAGTYRHAESHEEAEVMGMTFYGDKSKIEGLLLKVARVVSGGVVCCEASFGIPVPSGLIKM